MTLFVCSHHFGLNGIGAGAGNFEEREDGIEGIAVRLLHRPGFAENPRVLRRGNGDAGIPFLGKFQTKLYRHRPGKVREDFPMDEG